MAVALVCRHLRDLLQDHERSDLLYKEHTSEHGTIIADFSRQRVTGDTVKLLVDLADKVGHCWLYVWLMLCGHASDWQHPLWACA